MDVYTEMRMILEGTALRKNEGGWSAGATVLLRHSREAAEGVLMNIPVCYHCPVMIPAASFVFENVL